jgi:hypothetical protein
MDQSIKLDEQLQAIEVELLNIAKRERELIVEQKKLRCEKNQSCSVVELLSTVQIG